MLKRQKEKVVLVFVSCKIGKKKVDKEKYNQFLEMLRECKCGMGALGGIARNGLYFVGCDDDEIVYLDPHYAQR